MLKKAWLLVGLLALGLQGCANSNNPKMPYDSWYFEAIYPHYMEVEIQYALATTQDNKTYNIRVSLNESTESEGKWSDYPGGSGGGLNMSIDLPKRIGICWLSHLDKKTYWAEFYVPLSARQQMTTPIKYYSEIMKEEQILYYDVLRVGLAPDGSVTAWMMGVPLPRGTPVAPIVAKVQGREMIKHPNCNSSYDDPNDIPDISDEGKAWIKAHGLPTSW